MAALDALVGLGYDVQIATGSVAAEEAALAAARERADPVTVQADLQELATNAVGAIGKDGRRRGMTNEQIAETIATVTARALEHLTDARTAEVVFFERALEIAQGLPTTYVVSGPGVVTVYIDIDDATGNPTGESAETVASLIDPAAHAERVFQHRLRAHPKVDEISGYVRTLREKGYVVEAQIQPDGTGLQALIKAAGKPDVVADTLPKLKTAATTLPKL